MAAFNICRNFLPRRILGPRIIFSSRIISSSANKKESSESCPRPETIYKKIPDFSKPLENKNWVSYGYSADDEEADRYTLHNAMFGIISVAMGGMLFILLYYPDKNRHNWAQREAFIRLHEREQLGLELIDPNYVDPSKINLPPDEELAEEAIII